MDIAQTLMDEHRVIERVLDALEIAARRLGAGDPVSPALFLQAADFVKGFADGCHHMKEEDILFPAMQASAGPDESGPIGVLLDDHREGRRLNAAMRAAAEGLAAGDDKARLELIRVATQYVELLRAHIEMEDSAVFPMAEQMLPESAQADVSRAIERLVREEADQGLRDRYLKLAASIERLAAG